MVWLAAVYAAIWKRQQSISVLIQFFGCRVWCCGRARLGGWHLGCFGYAVVAHVFGALHCGGGERLELSHVAFIAAWVEPALITLSCLVLIALAVLRVLPVLGYILLGAVLCALLAVAVYNDTAVRTFKLRGFTGLMGRAMLCAYV